MLKNIYIIYKIKIEQLICQYKIIIFHSKHDLDYKMESFDDENVQELYESLANGSYKSIVWS